MPATGTLNISGTAAVTAGNVTDAEAAPRTCCG